MISKKLHLEDGLNCQIPKVYSQKIDLILISYSILLGLLQYKTYTSLCL
jgi:hypothetical protein